MKKRSLILGIAVLVCSALIFSGCEQETKTEYVNVPGGGEFFQLPADAVQAESIAALEVLLADTSGLYTNIVYEDTSAPPVAVTVPAGKALYLNSSGGGSGITLAADLTVAGKLVVYNGSFTPGAFLKGAGTLDVEMGSSMTVTDDALFTGAAQLGAVNIKKYATLDASGATVDTVAKVTAWVGYAGNGYLSLAVTTITPQVTLTAIGARSDTNSVAVENDVAPTEASLTVPAGVALKTSNALTAVTSLTVNGRLSATNGTLATAGAAITLGSKGEVSLGDVKLASNVTVPAGASFSIGTSSDFDGKTVTFKAGSSDIISDIDLVISGISTGGYELNGSIELTAGQNIVIPDGKSITVKAGSTITNAGTITLGAGASLVLTGAADTGGAKITGAGKIVAANTEITGEWQAVDTGTSADTVTITATDADESSITSSATTVSLTAGTGGTITQNAVASNNLTIATDTTIALGGTGEKLGEIVLKGAAADTGKLTLIGTITTGNASANPAVTAAALSTDGTTTVAISAYTKIGVANLVGDGTKAKVEPTNAVSGADAAAAGKIVKLTGESGATISAGTSDGTISGATATVATT